MARSAKDTQIAEYKDLISQLNKTIAALTAELQSERQSRKEDRQVIANLQEQIEYLTRKLFGTSSERRTGIEGQLNLFDEAETLEDTMQEEVPAVEITYTRKARSSHKEMFHGIPVCDELIPLPDDKKICPECGTPLTYVGKEFNRMFPKL